MDENSEEGRVLAHCVTLPGPDPNPRGPSRTHGANPCALSPPSQRCRQRKLTFAERLVVTEQSPQMMSRDHPRSTPVGILPKRKRRCRKHKKPAQGHPSREL